MAIDSATPQLQRRVREALDRLDRPGELPEGWTARRADVGDHWLIDAGLPLLFVVAYRPDEVAVVSLVRREMFEYLRGNA